MPVVKFCPIASGSSGNCIYAGTQQTHLLVDAGLSGKQIEKGMRQLNVPALHGILVTHEHSDHIAGVGVMSRRYKVPVYATPNTWRYFLRHNTIGTVDPELRKVIEPGRRVTIGDMEVQAFDIPHDSSQPVGYCLYAQNYKISVATDMGCVTDTIREHIKDSHILLLESNHDIEMLRNGRYPKQLKERVMGSRGHLSNVSAGTLITEIASAALQHIFLGHLSEENNRPMIALDTVQRILEANQVIVKHLMVADRHCLSEVVEL